LQIAPLRTPLVNTVTLTLELTAAEHKTLKWLAEDGIPTEARMAGRPALKDELVNLDPILRQLEPGKPLILQDHAMSALRRALEYGAARNTSELEEHRMAHHKEALGTLISKLRMLLRSNNNG
jgi:hypothetical protein